MQNPFAVEQDSSLSKLDVIENVFSIETLYQDKDHTWRWNIEYISTKSRNNMHLLLLFYYFGSDKKIYSKTRKEIKFRVKKITLSVNVHSETYIVKYST